MTTQNPQRTVTSPETIRACMDIVEEFTAWAQAEVKVSTDPMVVVALLRAQSNLIRIVREVSGV